MLCCTFSSHSCYIGNIIAHSDQARPRACTLKKGEVDKDGGDDDDDDDDEEAENINDDIFDEDYVPMKSNKDKDSSDDGDKDDGTDDDNDDNDDDDGDGDDDDDDDDDSGRVNDRSCRRTPFVAAWIVPIIRPVIADRPMASNKHLMEVLKLYGNDYAFTKSLLQNARRMARQAIFGNGTGNAKYILALKSELELRQHVVDVLFLTREHALQRLLTIVMDEEAEGKKKKHGLGETRRAKDYVRKWMRENSRFIDEHLGTEQENLRFVEGILFAPCTSQRTVPKLQSVYQADAAHLNWGKYTLYSAYGTTSEGQCSPVSFGILFGNEDMDSWCKFWEFAASVHPSLDSAENTIITDQDKGSKAAIAAILPSVFNFHCSYHRRQNILKNCRGGTQVYKALWMFNQLVEAPTLAVLNSKRTRGYAQMADKDKQYLDSVLDVEQYPAARCSMGPDVKMYGRSASSGVEAMNAVNMGIRERCCVCLVNATILLLKMEADRLDCMKDRAWAHDGLLTPYGRKLVDEVYKEVPNHRDYTIQRAEYELYEEFKVRGNHTGSQNQTVKVMKEMYMGHRATSCTCGVPQMTCIPCRHIVAVAKSGKSEGLNLVTATPYFWSTGWWRNQFPREDAIRCNIDVEYLKERHGPDNSIRFVPDVVGVRKKGRPKKGSRKKSPLEEVLAKSRGEKNVRKRRIATEAELLELDPVEDLLNSGGGGGGRQGFEEGEV